MDSTGVIPEPAAISPWWVPAASSGVNAPAGGATSTSSPGRTPSTSHSENSPPSIRRTPTRSAAPTGAQIEYDRRCSAPSASYWRSVRYWPGRKVYRSRSSSGTSKLTATASSHSRSTLTTRSVWKPLVSGATSSSVLAGALTSDLLHVLEGFPAGRAAAQLGARGRAEAGQLLGARRAAAGAAHPGGGRRVEGQWDRPGIRPPGSPARRRDTGLGKLAPAILGDPVGAPRRGEHGAHVDPAIPRRGQGGPQVGAHLVQRGAAGVGRRDGHRDRVPLGLDPADHAQVSEGEHGHLGVHHAGHHGGRVDQFGAGTHHVASGSWRAKLCISASTCPSASVCTPWRPPRPPIVPAGERSGRVNVARRNTSSSTSSTSALVSAGSTATPPAANLRSTSEVRNSSSTLGHTQSSAALIRWCESSVPSPRRSAQRAA